MGRRLSVMLITIAVVTAVILGLVVLLEKDKTPQPAQENKLGESAADDGYKYILRSADGKLAVYKSGSTEPDMIFEVYIHHLPRMDQQLLSSGIYVRDYATLMSLIEDYIS